MLLGDGDETGRSALSPCGAGAAWVLQEMPLPRAGCESGQLLREFLTSCPTCLVSTWENPCIAQHGPSQGLPRVCLSRQEEALGDAGASALQKILPLL